MKTLIYALLIGVILFTGLLSSNHGGTPGEEFPSLFMKKGRFFWVTTADLDRDGKPEIIAAGQVGPKKSHQGYIGIYKLEPDGMVLLAEDIFSVTHEGKTLPTRVRAIVAADDPVSGQWELYAAGRSGEDETGTGFIRKSVYTGGGDKKLKEVDTLVFQSSDSQYTHGYPIASINLHGQKRAGIVYGGFSGSPGSDGEDRADVRVFPTGAGETFSKEPLRPFDALAIPLRINALATGDIDGDGKDDIVIAGRSKTDKGEKAAFACWSDGKLYHKVLDEEDAGRFRSLLISDLDGDGKMEILTGGRTDVGDVLLARLECWHLQGQSFQLVSRYTWTADRSTRLRAFVRHPGKNVFYAAGRTELLNGEELEWTGFVRAFDFENNRVLPSGKPMYIKHDWETRIRHIVFYGNDRLLIAGFCMDPEKKEKAFLQLVDLR